MVEDLLVLSALIRRELGIDYSEHLDQLARKVHSRIEASACGSLPEYLSKLQSDTFRFDEIHELANVVSNNETYFFREQAQLSAVCGHLIPEILREQKTAGRIRILSVPCSSGEEPYSIVMNLLMHGQPLGSRISVYGADISGRALELAQAGRYRDMSFRGVSPEVIERFFDQVGDMRVLKPHVQRFVQFRYANLIDPHALAFAAPYDIIFCRNVMIYFDLETQAKVLDVLSSVLAPGGYLCMGHADASHALFTDFNVSVILGSVIYRRKKILQSSRPTR